MAYVQVRSEGLRTRSADVQGQEKMDVPPQAEGANPHFFCLFVLSMLSMVWKIPIHISKGGSSLFTLLIRMLISSRNPLTTAQK